MRSGSAIGLQAGEQWTVRDLLHVMLLHSANDAAVALAEASAGSVARFAARMNAKARQIGARESHFTNPNGLHDPRHYTTASDLAIIARTGLRVPALAAIVRTKVWEMDRPGRAGEVYVNRNKLLTRYEGADGVKTGFTAASGHVLVASATRNDWQLLSVVLKSADPYADTEQLLNFGFATFAPVVLARRGAVLATVTIGTRHARLSAVVPSDVHAVVRRGASVASRVALRPGLQPPIPAGAQVGEVRFVEGQSVVAKSVLIAGEPVGR
jgi:D-alanyl-D-alanine carboxypeptidase (penicillin-binding protein 5/6)